MASPNPFLHRVAALWRWTPYAVLVGLFLWVCALFYLPQEGFTALVVFGQKRSATYLPELRSTNFYAERNSDGYDAQYYAQIAMHPQLGDPVLRDAVDSLPYRARRILFCWTAYVLGAGNPVWALHVYSVQNIIAWVLLAWVLLRWFPPTSVQNFLRWSVVLFTYGLCFSVRDSLVDGPSLLLIAVGMALLESGRPGWSAAVMGIAGLGKETNILAGAALAPANWRDRQGWLAAVKRGLLVVAPLAAWLLCLKLWLGTGGDAGARNFDWPFVGYVGKWREVLAPVRSGSFALFDLASLLALVALTVQWLFLVLRPRWSDPWWRVGASYAVLMVVLGEAVWEGNPGAAPRVLLPITLVFNVLLPHARRWWPVFILGNLLIWPSFDTLVPPAHGDTYVFGPHKLRVEETTGSEVTVQFPEQDWHWIERSYLEYWRWARGAAEVRMHNPHPYPITAEVRFRVKSSDARSVTLRSGDQVLWHGRTERTTPNLVFSQVQLPPGDTVWRFETDRPPMTPGKGDDRPLSFRVYNFVMTVTGRG